MGQLLGAVPERLPDAAEFPHGQYDPQPDAADCRFTDGTSQVFQCDLREGLRFSSGTPVDAEAVKHSIERIRTINAEGGPSGLLGSSTRSRRTATGR